MHCYPLIRLALALATLSVLAVAALAAPSAGAQAAEEKLLVTSKMTYDLTAEQGPVRVTWDMDLVNNDPETQNKPEGRIFFYESISLPVLRGASNAAALSSEGKPLGTSIDSSGQGLAVLASVRFDRRLFYQDTYHLTLTYDLSNVRERWLLVTPFYVFLPAIAAGREATVSVKTPEEPPWTVEVEPVDCAGDNAGLACAGSEEVYLAALVEVSRPDATVGRSFDVQLREKKVSLSLTYFRGEEAFAQHVQDLTSAALPIMEDVYGVPYTGPPSIKISQGGRQQVLGYEGVTSCDAGSCSIVVSPIADDITILHELSHVWSSLYGNRWLSEGFAQFVAEETGARIPELLRPLPPPQPVGNVDLQLDEWGEVTSIIGANETELDFQAAGYDRSLRFLTTLRAEVGLDALQKANQAIAAGGRAADSRRFMDALEDTSGRDLDDLFKLWVFPEPVHPLLERRREARDRLTALESSIEGTGLSREVPDAIRRDISEWNFDEAAAALDDAEAGLKTYDELLPRLETLKTGAEGAGLTLGGSIEERLLGWQFGEAGRLLEAAEQALATYNAAWSRVNEPRNLWQKFGLLGSDPDSRLRAAAGAFARGDYDAAAQRAAGAADMIDDASDVAFRRLLIVGGLFALLALALGVAFWVSRARRRALA